MGGAYHGQDRDVVLVAKGPPYFLHGSKELHHVPASTSVPFSYGECICEFHVGEYSISDTVPAKSETENLITLRLRHIKSPCLVVHHFPRTRVSILVGEEVGHSGAEHSHLWITVREVHCKSFLLTDSVLCSCLRWHHLKLTWYKIYIFRDSVANTSGPFSGVTSSLAVNRGAL